MCLNKEFIMKVSFNNNQSFAALRFSDNNAKKVLEQKFLCDGGENLRAYFEKYIAKPISEIGEDLFFDGEHVSYSIIENGRRRFYKVSNKQMPQVSYSNDKIITFFGEKPIDIEYQTSQNAMGSVGRELQLAPRFLRPFIAGREIITHSTSTSEVPTKLKSVYA